AIKLPIKGTVTHLQQKNAAQQSPLTDLRIIRYEYQKGVSDNLSKSALDAADARQEAERVDETTCTTCMKEFWNKRSWRIQEYACKMRFMAMMAFTVILETLAFWALRIATYVILAFQVVFSGILLIFGPIAVALSILPGFKDSFTTWIGRFISINL